MRVSWREGTTSGLLARVPDWAILLGFCLVFSLQVVLAGVQKSATFDEPANLASGYVELTLGDYWLLPENLPFVKQLAAFPLLFVDVRLPSAADLGRHAWAFGHRLLYDDNDGDRFLLLGRLAVLPVSLLLGCLVFRWATELFGRAAGLSALFLYTFEPNILAHSGLVTTDLAVACWMFAAIYGLYRVTHQVSVAGLLLPGLSLGLALLTKYTLHPLVLILMLLALAASLAPQPIALRLPGLSPRQVSDRSHKLLALFLVLLCWSLLAYGMLWAAYGFRYQAVAAHGVASPRSWDSVQLQQSSLQKTILWARQVRVFPEAYLYGLSSQLKKSGHFNAFLLGQIRSGGWWYYFLVTFLIKTPVALLILLLMAIGVQGRQWRADPLRAAFLLGPVLVYFSIISASGWNIGHRHLLPIYPFLFVLVGGLVPWVGRQRAVVKGGVAVLAAWYLAASVAIFPHYLASFNELVGGPGQGYKYLVDSNLDWGQDLKGLKRYMDTHGIDRVWLSYFGTASPDYYGIAYNYLPSYTIFGPRGDKIPTPFVAISATALQGVCLLEDPEFFKDFRERTPMAKIGYSIFIYRLE